VPLPSFFLLSEMSASSVRLNYQRIREQLIGLTVELEDKNNICNALGNRIETERLTLSRVEAEANEEYAQVLERTAQAHKDEIDKIMQNSSKLMSEKKELLGVCQDLVDSLKEMEKENAAELKRISAQYEDLVEQDKRRFRAGQEERLEKFLANKASEYKEMTSKALQPEIARLQQMHESDIAQTHANYRSQERRLIEDMNKRIQEAIEEERRSIIESQRTSITDRTHTINMELEAADREHRFRMDALKEDLDRDVEKVKAALGSKVDKERKNGQIEVYVAQENCKRRLGEARSQHLTEVARLQNEHDEKIRSTKKLSSQRRAEIEESIRAEAGSNPNSPNKKGSPKRMYDGFDDDVQRQEVENERDKRIQGEIRQLQAETIRLERNWKSAAEKERKEISELRSREENEYQRRQRQLAEEIAEYAVLREQLSQEVKELSKKVAGIDEESKHYQSEIEVYESGIQAHKLRAKDASSIHAIREREELALADQKIADLRLKCEKMSAAMHEKNNRLERETGESEDSHRLELARLDDQVKADVAKKDEELEYLRDAVHTEKVKLARLEKLLRQYTSSR